MFQMLKEIYAYRDLMFMLTFRDLRVRYKQAAMGFVWAIFMPVVAVCAGIVIKKAMAIVAHRPLEVEGIASMSVKVLPWTFFISSIRFSVQALVGNGALVTKIYFPRAVLVLSSILACLVDFGIALIVSVIILTVLKIGVSIYLLWVPFFLFFLIIYTFGLGLILSAANLFYRDVKYVVEVILMFGIFFTPVFYDASTFGRLESTMLILNPLGALLEQINRIVVLHQMPDAVWTYYVVAASLVLFMLGTTIFRITEPLFAENI